MIRDSFEKAEKAEKKIKTVQKKMRSKATKKSILKSIDSDVENYEPVEDENSEKSSNRLEVFNNFLKSMQVPKLKTTT